jgi:hypothetical protein
MADIATLNLKEPEQLNWDAEDRKYIPPPPALDANGQAIVYQAQIASTAGQPQSLSADQEGNLRVAFGPLKLVKNGNGADGYEIRFYDASTKKFRSRKTGDPIEMSSISKVLRAAGVTAKPQKNAEYVAAARQAAGRVVPLTIDWSAKNRDTGEEIKGYNNFPLDPERPGTRKAILRQGDVLPDGRVVASEVLFANARVENIVSKRA